MINHFKKISKLCIGGLDVPQRIIDKIIEFHTEPMNKVREELGVPIYASQESGFRPYYWERARGRSGTSQHCFGQKASGIIYSGEKGAVDWTCKDFKKNSEKLLALMVENTSYNRLAIYDSFIHADYKDTPSGKRELYKSNSQSKWQRIGII